MKPFFRVHIDSYVEDEILESLKANGLYMPDLLYRFFSRPQSERGVVGRVLRQGTDRYLEDYAHGFNIDEVWIPEFESEQEFLGLKMTDYVWASNEGDLRKSYSLIEQDEGRHFVSIYDRDRMIDRGDDIYSFAAKKRDSLIAILELVYAHSPGDLPWTSPLR